MPIAPVNDVIQQSLAAADSASRASATARLQRMSKEAAATVPKSPANAVSPPLSTDVRTALTAQRIGDTLVSGGHQAKAFRNFEAMMLQNAVESMMPKDQTAMFGSGTAGAVWKSWMSQAVARELAQSGGIGIAAQLQERFSVASPATVTGNPAGETNTGGTGSALRSTMRDFLSTLQDLFTLFPMTGEVAPGTGEVGNDRR